MNKNKLKPTPTGAAGILLCGCKDYFDKIVQPIRTSQGTLAICACPHPHIAYTRAVFSNFDSKSYSILRNKDDTFTLKINDPGILVRLLTFPIQGHVYEFVRDENFEQNNIHDYRAYQPLSHCGRMPVGIRDLSIPFDEKTFSYQIPPVNRGLAKMYS